MDQSLSIPLNEGSLLHMSEFHWFLSVSLICSERAEQGLEEVDWALPALRNYSSQLTNSSSFMKTIHGVLHPEEEEFAPPRMYVTIAVCLPNVQLSDLRFP